MVLLSTRVLEKRHVDIDRRPVRHRYRGEQGYRQGNRHGFCPQRRQGARRVPPSRRGGSLRRGVAPRRRDGQGPRGRRDEDWRHASDGGCCRRGARRHRHIVRQCRHFPADEDRGTVARGLGLRRGDEFERHVPTDQGLPAAPQEVGPGPRGHHLVDNRAGHRLSRLGSLWRDQGRPARLHAHGLHRARQIRHYRQCRAARQCPDRRLDRARAGI